MDEQTKTFAIPMLLIFFIPIMLNGQVEVLIQLLLTTYYGLASWIKTEFIPHWQLWVFMMVVNTLLFYQFDRRRKQRETEPSLNHEHMSIIPLRDISHT